MMARIWACVMGYFAEIGAFRGDIGDLWTGWSLYGAGLGRQAGVRSTMRRRKGGEMTPEQCESLAGGLLQARRDCAVLAKGDRPSGFEDAYAVQDAVVAGSARDPIGFKIGATSVKAQTLLGVDGPFSGRILAGGLHDSPTVLVAADFYFRLIEPEFAFRLASDLPARDTAYSEDEVADAVASLHPALEVVTSAYGETWTAAGGPALIADNGVHGALVLGPGTADWRGLDLPSHAVSLQHNGAQISEGIGGNAMGGPLTALTWLANQQRGFGRGLRAGEVVTTGLVTDFVMAEAGGRILADHGVLGQVEVEFQ